jgi:hypothetical protein
MQNKLGMIRYYQTQLTHIHRNGGAFYKPMFFEFPDDAGAYEALQLNIMLGSSIKLSVQSTNVT